MNNVKKLALAIAVAASPHLVQAAEMPKPELFGFISAGALKTDDQDFEAEAFEIELGLKGKLTANDLNFIYQVEVDLAKAANSADAGKDEDQIHIKEASIKIPTRYGGFLIAARGMAGYHYEYNEPHAAYDPDGIFNQPDRSSGTFAYATPQFFNGTTHVVVSAITLKQDNDEDVDATTARIVFDKGPLHLGIGTAQLKAAQLPPFTSEDMRISALSAGYNFGRVQLGAVWEHTDNEPYALSPTGAADSDSYGISANVDLGDGYGFAIGYKEKDHDYAARDESVYTLKVERKLDDQVKIWAETGQYDTAASNYALGVNLRF